MENVYCANCGRLEDFDSENNRVMIENGKPIFFCRDACRFTYELAKKFKVTPLKIRREKK